MLATRRRRARRATWRWWRLIARRGRRWARLQRQVAQTPLAVQCLQRLAHAGELGRVHGLTVLLAPGQQAVVAKQMLGISTAGTAPIA